MTKDEFSERLRLAGKGHIEAAALLGVTPERIADWASGREPVPAEFAEKLQAWQPLKRPPRDF
jgi:DNA-binding transcriptional regulator YdaS (Cro superfamily)